MVWYGKGIYNLWHHHYKHQNNKLLYKSGDIIHVNVAKSIFQVNFPLHVQQLVDVYVCRVCLFSIKIPPYSHVYFCSLVGVLLITMSHTIQYMHDTQIIFLECFSSHQPTHTHAMRMFGNPMLIRKKKKFPFTSINYSPVLF